MKITALVFVRSVLVPLVLVPSVLVPLELVAKWLSERFPPSGTQILGFTQGVLGSSTSVRFLNRFVPILELHVAPLR